LLAVAKAKTKKQTAGRQRLALHFNWIWVFFLCKYIFLPTRWLAVSRSIWWIRTHIVADRTGSSWSPRTWSPSGWYNVEINIISMHNTYGYGSGLGWRGDVGRKWLEIDWYYCITNREITVRRGKHMGKVVAVGLSVMHQNTIIFLALKSI